ncbi:hypothetical protein C8Q76DRAFT_473079 [Earliella scabrosa]|nr:hypothetical protein C8Q76DRAFT_473079 [Earliella scabrosa]
MYHLKSSRPYFDAVSFTFQRGTASRVAKLRSALSRLLPLSMKHSACAFSYSIESTRHDYRHTNGPVVSLTVSKSGKWIASGDATRISFWDTDYDATLAWRPVSHSSDMPAAAVVGSTFDSAHFCYFVVADPNVPETTGSMFLILGTRTARNDFPVLSPTIRLYNPEWYSKIITFVCYSSSNLAFISEDGTMNAMDVRKPHYIG